jgi:hypothetical protein
MTGIRHRRTLLQEGWREVVERRFVTECPDFAHLCFDETSVRILIDGDFVEGPRNDEFRIVRGTVWTTNTVAAAGCDLIFVNLSRGGVCIRRVKLLAE